ncbi:MAG: hypothetical protein KA146_05455 [Leptospiraceae bacterium]|nr:hypothetical protein [Leptospiraceae bacterium]
MSVNQKGERNISLGGNAIYNEDNRKININIQIDNSISNFIESKEIQYNHYITNIYNELDKIEIPNKETYEKKLDNWLTGWRKLDSNSREYLISGEYFYECLEKSQGIDDYSPFVLQFCRVIENQIGILFKGLETKYDNLNLDTNTKNQQFAEVNRNSLSGDPRGGITDLVNFCKNENNFRSDNKFSFSKKIIILKGLSETHQKNWSLIQFINSYLDSFLDRNTILVLSYIEKIDLMRSKYRNASAHSGILTKVDALIFRELMTEEILPVWVKGLK